MEEKKFIKYKHDELTNADIFETSTTCNVRIDIVEDLDNVMMQAIRRIGGKEYVHIAIDKNKVVAALEKSVKKQVVKYKLNLVHFDCPSCRALLTHERSENKKPCCRPNYCFNCGQALDWED